jgi:hypothetical protein
LLNLPPAIAPARATNLDPIHNHTYEHSDKDLDIYYNLHIIPPPLRNLSPIRHVEKNSLLSNNTPLCAINFIDKKNLLVSRPIYRFSSDGTLI